MPDDAPVPAAEYSARVIDAMIEVLKASTSPEMQQAQAILIRRLALSGDLIPSRIAPPRNISEVGGYINLLARLNEAELRAQVLASILGVAGPNPPAGGVPGGPVRGVARRPHAPPAGPAPPVIPVSFTVRSDFAAALDAALLTIREKGCALPLLAPVRTLPPLTAAPPADPLVCLGRTLDLVPAAALVDPDADPLALASTGGPLQVVARQVDAAAPQAASVVAASWDAWQCTATVCTLSTAMRTYLPLAPILNAAGWYQPAPAVPVSLAAPGAWGHWTNITGLVAGVTKLGDELTLLYTPVEITASALRERLHWVWDGTQFQAPA